ncbi:hypothetical protein JMJ77_0013965, partial [Colletotrichum scovillei]
KEVFNQTKTPRKASKGVSPGSPFADRGDLELVQVPNLGAQHTLDQAIKGTSAIAQTGSILSFSDSSRMQYLQSSTVWSRFSRPRLASSPPPPPHAPDHWHIVYQASKVEAEKALWAFVNKNKPHYTVNVVSPATVLGEALCQRHVVYHTRG